MPQIEKIGAVDFLRDELSEIDKRLDELHAERSRVANYLKKLTGADPAPYNGGNPSSEASSTVTALTAPERVQAIPFEDSPTTQGGAERVYHSRQFNKRLVEEALEIILASNRPMSTPEIMRTHTMREQVSAESLYRLMYNRVVTGSLMSLDGAFWPEGTPLPSGWSLKKAKRAAIRSAK